MTKYIVQGGHPLFGEVHISGAKNAALPILAATVLVDGVCRIENIPQISDVTALLKILEQLGANVRFLNRSDVEIDCRHIATTQVSQELAHKIRASYYLIGALLGRFGEAEVSMPGGCNFGGVRPIDQHVKGFAAMGAEVREGDFICAKASGDRMKGANVYLDVVSVGATMNIMMAAALALLFAGALAQKRQVMLDKVVAVVGSSSILHSEVAEYARQLTAQRRAEGYTSDRDPMNEALEALMTQKLLFNQAQIDSVKINAGDIATHVEQQIQNMIETEGSIPKLEAKHHMAIFSIRENMRQRYEEQSYASSMQSEVVSKVSVIPGEVEHFYKSIDKDSLPTVAEQYVYAQITRFPKSITQAKQRTRERLLDMRERIITGKAKFENLARMYSQDPGTMMRGGEMDPTELNGLEAPFADALENMKPGQISEVVETRYGQHIIQLLDKRGSLYHFRHILLRPVYTMDELNEGVVFLDSIANQIRKDSLSFDKAALQFSDDATSKMNGGIVSNHDILERFNAFEAKLTVTKFLREDFAHFGALDDYNALIRLKPGEISPAFLTEDIMGNQLAKIVKLVEIIPTHVASLNEDYLRLEEMALNAKQERVFKEWLTKKIDAMYVYIAPEFRDGEFENKSWVK